MLVILGIVIFIISFGVALVSLIREEKQQQELIAQKQAEEADTSKAQQAEALAQEASFAVSKSGTGFADLAAKVDAEQKKQSGTLQEQAPAEAVQDQAGFDNAPAGAVQDETVQTGDNASLDFNAPSDTIQRAAFPWENDNADVESLDIVPGDSVVEDVAPGASQDFGDVKISPADARFPTLDPGHKPLSGEFKLRDMKKSQ